MDRRDFLGSMIAVGSIPVVGTAIASPVPAPIAPRVIPKFELRHGVIMMDDQVVKGPVRLLTPLPVNSANGVVAVQFQFFPQGSVIWGVRLTDWLEHEFKANETPKALREVVLPEGTRTLAYCLEEGKLTYMNEFTHMRWTVSPERVGFDIPGACLTVEQKPEIVG